MKVRIILFGGLGNQLFQYFSANFLAHKFGGVVKIDSTFSQFGRSGHSDWIGDLTLPGAISPSAPEGSLAFWISVAKKKARDYLARQIKSKDLLLKVFQQYNSPVLGYDPKLEELVPPVTLMGYFQTWKYHNALKDEGLIPEIQMKNPSNWFIEASSQFEKQGKVLSIHVRRGDYVGTRFGTLSSAYYDSAIKKLKGRGVMWDAIWIFSDDIPLTQSEFQGVFTESDNVVFVDPDLDSHSFESLLLMSQSSSLIIANSTFSWWAAVLGNSEKYVVCPSKWFSHLEDPEDLYPDNWIRVQSEWILL
jgi:hypothetical protein